MHLTDEQLRSFTARQGSPDELLDWSDHLAACEECRARFAAIRSAPVGTRQVLSGFEEVSTHLTPEELAACADDTLDADTRVFAQHHLASCRGCREELEALRAFRQTLQTVPSRDETRRGGVPAAGELRSAGLLSRFAAWFASLPRAPFAITAIALLMIIVAIRLSPSTRDGARDGPGKVSPLAGTSIRDGTSAWLVDPQGRLAGAADLPEEARAPISEQKARWAQLPSQWRVTLSRVSDPDQSSPAAQEAERLRELRQKWNQSPLVMGMIYAQRGSFLAARDEFERALKENSGNPEARRLIEDLLHAVREKTKEPAQP